MSVAELHATMDGQQAESVGPAEEPLRRVPPSGSPPVFLGGAEAESTNPWRNSFVEHSCAPASEAGPILS
eukprot:9561470-Alexandrium_andersonii.AAC.1